MTPKRLEEIREWAEGFAQFQPFPVPKDRAIAELLTALDEVEERICFGDRDGCACQRHCDMDAEGTR